MRARLGKSWATGEPMSRVLISSERARVSGTTHLEEKGLRKGRGQQWSQTGVGAPFPSTC